MVVNNYESFKEAVDNVKKEEHKLLMFDLEKVKAFVEKVLTLCLESNTNKTLTNYHNVVNF